MRTMHIDHVRKVALPSATLNDQSQLVGETHTMRGLEKGCLFLIYFFELEMLPVSMAREQRAQLRSLGENLYWVLMNALHTQSGS